MMYKKGNAESYVHSLHVLSWGKQ